MDEKVKKNILRAIIILAFFSLVISFYLTMDHYKGSGEGSFCDINSTISCSKATGSIFSELFGIPVALLGMIWSFSLMLFGWQILKKKERLLKLLLIWGIIGILFVIYMVIAEFLVGAICPLCTVVHILVLINLSLSVYLYKGNKK